LRTAAVQFALRPETSFDQFATHMSGVVVDAVSAGAELIVFPELVGTGLLASHPDAGSLAAADMRRVYRELFPPLADPFSALLAGLAREHQVTISGGSHYRATDANRFRNTAYLAHPDGHIIEQDKLHLTPPEVEIGTDLGDELLISTVGPARVATLICMDLQYPELARHLVEHRVDIILCPSLTWNRRGAHRMRYASHSRAMENQMFVATSASLGTCGVPRGAAMHGTGQAMITCPINATFGVHDGLLAEATAGTDTLAIADLDLDRLRTSRANPEPPGIVNLRPELYRTLNAATTVA
jgi:predicted amidohydrolase